MGKLLLCGDVFLKDNNYQLDVDTDFICNLEYVLDGDFHTPITNKINLRGTADFSGYKRKPLAVNLANNHILDFKEKGFENTIDILKSEGILYFGAGTIKDNFNNPCIIIISQKKIGLLGYSDIVPLLCNEKLKYQVADVNRDRIRKDIEQCKKAGVDYIIVNIHWGREERPLNTKRQEAIGKFLVEEGADLVIGHHPHCIQPYIIHNNKYIFYSLGNFMFSDIALPSYYDKNGTSEFIMHKKHFKYGKQSLVVEFDTNIGKCAHIWKTEFDGYKVKKLKDIKGKDSIPILYKNLVINEVIGFIRMGALLVRSNFMVDNKIINYNAYKKELDFLKVRFRK